MRYQSFIALFVAGVSVFATGCATKNFVRKSVDPVSNRVDQVAKQTTQQGEALEATKRDVEANERDISATRETAKGADARAGDAIERAGEALKSAQTANSKADQNSSALNELRSTVANLDDYRPASTVVIPFGFNKTTLTPQAQAEIDRLAQSRTQWKRYFISVEGFTDRVGTASYNDELSKKRADKVVQYLVTKYDIPVYRIHEIGLGKEKLADPGRGRAANAQNRRVEVTVYTVDATMASKSTVRPAQ